MTYQRYRNALANVNTGDLKALRASVASQPVNLPAHENTIKAIDHELSRR
jgi:hypothetical protein